MGTLYHRKRAPRRFEAPLRPNGSLRLPVAPDGQTHEADAHHAGIGRRFRDLGVDPDHFDINPVEHLPELEVQPPGARRIIQDEGVPLGNRDAVDDRRSAPDGDEEIVGDSMGVHLGQENIRVRTPYEEVDCVLLVENHDVQLLPLDTIEVVDGGGRETHLIGAASPPGEADLAEGIIVDAAEHAGVDDVGVSVDGCEEREDRAHSTDEERFHVH